MRCAPTGTWMTRQRPSTSCTTLGRRTSSTCAGGGIGPLTIRYQAAPTDAAALDDVMSVDDVYKPALVSYGCGAR